MITESPFSAGEMAERVREVRKVVDALEDQLDHAKAELEWLEAGRKLLGFDEQRAEQPAELELEIEDAASANGTVPSLRNRVLIVLGQEPRKRWKTKEIVDEMRRREWLPKGEYGEHHVRSMVARMGRKGEIRKVAHGVYRLPPEPKGES